MDSKQVQLHISGASVTVSEESLYAKYALGFVEQGKAQTLLQRVVGIQESQEFARSRQLYARCILTLQWIEKQHLQIG